MLGVFKMLGKSRRIVGTALALILGCSAIGKAETALPAAETFMRGFCPAGDQQVECEYNLQTFPEDYAGAVAGDYQGQRNVAFCLATGCQGAVEQRPVLACAWRKVILASAHLELDQGDFMSHRNACANLSGVEHAVAYSQAEVIFEAVRPNGYFPPELVAQPD